MADERQILINKRNASIQRGDQCCYIIENMERLRVLIQKEQEQMKLENLQAQMLEEKMKLEKEEKEFSKYFHMLDFSGIKKINTGNLLMDEWVSKLPSRLEELAKMHKSSE